MTNQLFYGDNLIEEKKRLDMRLGYEVLKSAEKQRENKTKQIELELE